MSELGDSEPPAAPGLAAIGERTGLLAAVGGGGAGARFLMAAMSFREGVEEETSFLGGGCIGSS